MSALKTYDSRNRLSSGLNGSQRSFRAGDQAGRTTSSVIDVEVKSSNHLTFAEDFLIEHSSAGLHFATIGIKCSSRTARKQPKPLPSAEYFGFPS